MLKKSLLVLLLLFSINAFAEENKSNQLMVTGDEEVNVEATLARTTLAVQIEDSTAGAAAKKAAKASSDVVTWLKSQKISKLKTTGVTLQPQYRYDTSKPTIVGYTASNQVSFETPVEEAGSILDEAIAKGATRIDNVEFAAPDDVLVAARLSAIERATLSAKTQGEKALSALGLSSKGVSSISINTPQNAVPYPRPQMARAMAMEAQGAPSTPVEGGELSVRASVTIGMSF